MTPSFDPLVFLNITDIEESRKDELKQELLDQISKYLTARILAILPNNKIDRCKDYGTLLAVAQKTIPDINKQVQRFMEDFRIEFQENLKNYG